MPKTCWPNEASPSPTRPFGTGVTRSAPTTLGGYGADGVGWAAFHGTRFLRWLGGVGDQVVISREAPVAIYGANDGGTIWRPSAMCIQEMLLSACFLDVSVFSRFHLLNQRHGTSMDHVVFHAYV